MCGRDYKYHTICWSENNFHEEMVLRKPVPQDAMSEKHEVVIGIRIDEGKHCHHRERHVDYGNDVDEPRLFDDFGSDLLTGARYIPLCGLTRYVVDHSIFHEKSKNSKHRLQTDWMKR
jgi:hypothetical protein